MVASNCLTGLETKALLAEGKTTIDQILKDHQLRYQQRDKQVNAWVCVNHSRPSQQDGLLRGVVIGIKDSISMFSVVFVVWLII
jgi:Asp-tRNA(Asn)/Glu-tRNA(Gln) amidotransferase A subunit family amidase